MAVQEPAHRVVVGLSPSETERMTGWVGVDLVPRHRIQVVGLQESSAQRDRLVVRGHRIRDVQVEVDLLRVAVGHSGATWSGACCTPITH